MLTRCIYIACISVFCLSICQAYTPTHEDQIQQSQLIQTIDKLSANKQDARHRYSQIFFLSQAYPQDTKIGYLLDSLQDHLYNKLDTRKADADKRSEPSKQEFIEKYADRVIDERALPVGCTGKYEMLDMVGYVHDIPTSLIAATRAKEGTCRLSLPGNGRGPYQITSKNYGTGEVTPSVLLQATEDFALFTRNKRNRYQKSNQKSGLTIDLGYTYLTLTGLVRHAALYNGLSGSTVYGEIQPKKAGYLYDNWGDFSGSNRQGLLPYVIQFLQWESK